MTRRLVILGRQGQLAAALATRCAGDERFEPVVIGRDGLDLFETGSIASHIADLAPAIVINAAAYTAVDKAEDDEEAACLLNAIAPGEIAKGARQVGAPVIHVSTDYVFDGTAARAYTETDPVAPLGVYGRTKQAGEQAVMSANPEHLIARTAWVYSVTGHNFIKTMLRLAETKDRLNIVDDQLGNPTAADDLAEALLVAARQLLDRKTAGTDAALYGIYHVAGTGTATWRELAEAAFRVMQAHGQSVPAVTAITSAQYPTPAARPANSRLNTSKFAAAFGHRLPPWRDSVQRVVDELLAGRAASNDVPSR